MPLFKHQRYFFFVEKTIHGLLLSAHEEVVFEVSQEVEFLGCLFAALLIRPDSLKPGFSLSAWHRLVLFAAVSINLTAAKQRLSWRIPRREAELLCTDPLTLAAQLAVPMATALVTTRCIGLGGSR